MSKKGPGGAFQPRPLTTIDLCFKSSRKMSKRSLRSGNSVCSSLPSLPENDVYSDVSWEESTDCSRYGSRTLTLSIFVVSALVLLSSAAYFPQPGGDRRRLSLRLTSSRTLLFDDGTLYVPPNSSDTMCEYLTSITRRHTAIKRIHVHFAEEVDLDACNGAKLIADTAGVPLTLTGNLCSSAMMADPAIVGPVPRDLDGSNEWTILKLCQACTTPFCQNQLDQTANIRDH